MGNRFWVDGVLQGLDFRPFTREDYAVIDCIGDINPDKAYGDVKTDCEYMLRRAYQAGVADAQPKPVTDEQLTALLKKLDTIAKEYDRDSWGLPVFAKNPRLAMCVVIRNWLAALNQPPAPSFD